MADCRDWLRTLWAASFKGFPVYIENDNESGGRRVVVHEFPNRDDPFLEDLGEMPRSFEASAYVASDNADTEALGFTTVLASSGPGILVLPTHGPRLVRCISFSRDRRKDQHGFIAFKVKFVREGAGAAIASVPFLANGIFAAVTGLAGALSAAFGGLVMAKGMADYVVSAASDAIALAGATVDGIRTSVAVDPDASASVRDAASLFMGSAPALVSRLSGANGEFATDFFDAVRDLSAGMRPEDAMRVFPTMAAQWTEIAPQPGATAAQVTATANANEIARVVRLAALSGYAEAVTRATFAARPDGITARADAAEWFEAELDALTGARYAPVYVATQEVRNGVVDYLTRLITDLAPVVTVTANVSLPSLFWAWRLYADPTRASEIVARNRVAHPSFMPTTFEALAR